MHSLTIPKSYHFLGIGGGGLMDFSVSPNQIGFAFDFIWSLTTDDIAAISYYNTTCNIELCVQFLSSDNIHTVVKNVLALCIML